MYGHERSLVNELADKPFALIGVNTDSSLEKFQGAVKENDLNWRSFYDGNPGGKIVVDYAIESFPTIILIDENGVVQSFNPCLLYTSPSPRDRTRSRMPSSA